MHRYFGEVAVADCFVVDEELLDAYKALLSDRLRCRNYPTQDQTPAPALSAGFGYRKRAVYIECCYFTTFSEKTLTATV